MIRALCAMLCLYYYSLTRAETPQLPPPLAFGLIYEGALGQPKIDDISL
jgi:hypothetical protein